MKVAHFTGLRQVEIVEVPRPRLAHADAVLLRINRVGLCGSDAHYYRNGRIGNQVIRYPNTVGHECAGTVVEVGAAVEALAPGDRVAVDPAMACGRCDQCHLNRPNTCRNVQFMGSPGEAPGAVAEYRVVPAENCFRIPETMMLDEAALVEPLSVGLYAVRRGRIPPAARIAIFGAGPIGLGALLCAKATASCTIYVTDLLDERLAAARRCGADWTGSPRREDVAAAIAAREPLGLDVVLECSGDPTCMDQAMQVLTPGGMLMLVGIPAADQVSFDPHRMRRAELTFQSVRRQKGCVAPVIELMSQGRLDPRPLLTHRFPLAEIAAAFELLADYRDGVIKAVIEM